MPIIKKKVPAGFWRIFSARMIDLIIITILSVGTLFLFLDQNTKHFYYSYNFYIWSILTIIYIFLIMVAIPLSFKGIGIGSWVTRIKIISISGNLYKNILKREIAYSFAWIFVILLTMSVVNHTLIDKVAILKGSFKVGSKTFGPENLQLTNLEKTRITLCGSISGLITFAQMWLAITIIPHPEKRGWLDRWANTKVIRINKTKDFFIEDKMEIIKPIKIKQAKVEYE
ncbi:MAG: RDD family protein [Mycoplasma sp.]|nr:RDD family protein [Mycoplasma sp.]